MVGRLVTINRMSPSNKKQQNVIKILVVIDYLSYEPKIISVGCLVWSGKQLQTVSLIINGVIRFA